MNSRINRRIVERRDHRTDSATPGGSPSPAVVRWLLEKNQPAVRLRALVELRGKGPGDPQVLSARRDLLRRGWAAEILARRTSRTGWDDGTSQYRPKYTSTNWMMLVLSDLGLRRTDPGVSELCEHWMAGFAAKDGGLGGNSQGTPHYCVAANMARALIRFGYERDPRVRLTLDRLVATADPKGGWSCWGFGRNLDSWEALSAFAASSRHRWTAEMRTCVERAAEYYLQRELYRQGERYAPWFRFHYPIHYYYDLLVGLDFMTALGYGNDPRLAYALRHLRSRRRRDGTWALDAVHPDVEGPIAGWFARHPRQRPVPFALETAGKPSKMITLTALRVLASAERSASTDSAMD